MDKQGINHQNSQSHDRFVDQIRLADYMGLNNQLPNMSTIPTPIKQVPTALPPNGQPVSSFASLHPPNPGVVPYNLSMPPANSAEQTSQPSQPSRRKKPSGGARSKEHWTVEQDAELCVAWLKISEDTVVGTGQRQEAFWKRVTDQFNSQMNDKGHDSSRSKDAAISRWCTIHPAVTKWTALYATLTKKLPPSSWQVPQLEDRARTMYHTKHKDVFKFEECWKVLRDSNKWQTWVQERMDATGGGDETSLQDTSTQPISAPIGQHDATAVPAESDLHSTPCDGNARSVCTAESERILAAVMDVDAKAEERIRRQDDLKRRRDEISDQRYLEQQQQYQEQKRMVEREHAANMGSKRIQLLKDLKYLTDQLVETYKDLEAINSSSILTSREQLEYDTKREWVERLQAERAEMNLLIDMTKIRSPDAQPPTSGGSTSGITPHCLDSG